MGFALLEQSCEQQKKNSFCFCIITFHALCIVRAYLQKKYKIPAIKTPLRFEIRF